MEGCSVVAGGPVRFAGEGKRVVRMISDYRKS